MGDANLFDDMDFGDIELVGSQNRPGPLTPKEEVIVVPTPAVVEKKTVSKKAKLKEETKAVVEKHSETVEAMKVEEEKKKAETTKNVIYIDAQNTDDRTKVLEFMQQGRLIMTDKNKPLILAEQKSPIHSTSKPAIHTVMCDEIIHVTIRRYYLDLEIMPVGKRTLAKEVIWVYHKGYQSQSMITREQLNYLIKNKFVKEIFYSYSDLSEGTSYFMGLDTKEPDTARINKMKAENNKNFNIQTGKIVVEEKTADPIEEEAIEEDIDLEGMEI